MEKNVVKELKGLCKEVKDILEWNIRARDDNWSLIFTYGLLYKGLEESFINNDIDAYRDALMDINVESLTRAKRKVQELYPELRGEKRKAREERQADFEEFSKTTQEEMEAFWEDGEED